MIGGYFVPEPEALLAGVGVAGVGLRVAGVGTREEGAGARPAEFGLAAGVGFLAAAAAGLKRFGGWG